jgi:hypothetical protein
MSLQITQNDFSDLFNNTFIMNTMIKKAIDMVIENFQQWKEYSPFSDRPSYDEDYTVVNIYEVNEKTLNLVCVNGSINVDYCYFTEIGIKKEKEFSVLTTYKLNSKTKMENLYQNIYELYEELTNNNPELDECERCKKCFYSKNQRGQFVSNVCQSCEAPLLLCLKGTLRIYNECNICFTKILENNKNKYNFKTIYSLNCCKGKVSCIDCLKKLKKTCQNCSPFSDNCFDRECPFCKQCLQVSKIYR